MYSQKSGLIFVLALVCTSLLQPRQMRASDDQSSPLPVRIAGPLPVPVQGTATVNGTVGATQNGAWNVGIAGMPTVKIGNPLPLVVEHAIQQPVQIYLPAVMSGPLGSFALYTVPAGKRLIVEHFSAYALIPDTATINPFGLAVSTGATFNFSHFIPTNSVTPGGPNFNKVVSSQPIRMYVDAGQTLSANVFASSTVGSAATINLSISGHLVDLVL